MKARITSNSPCTMTQGELRWVPQNQAGDPIGYYLCCPYCSCVTYIQNRLNGLNIDESKEVLVSFSKPIRCRYCNVMIHIEQCEITFEKDENMQHG
jgi:hypothetical protein